MKDFFSYFFGAGTEQEFFSFSFAHFAPIILMIGVIFLIYRKRDAIRAWKYEESIRYVLAFSLMISELSYFWRLVGVESLGANPVDHLPITVCGWAVVFASFMVIGKTQSLFDIVYFWVFSGSVFALATPTVLDFTGPTRFRYYQFWVEHTFGYIAIFYMIFVHGMRPTIKSAIRSYAALVVLALIAYWTNTMLPGANYLFMARAEGTTSVLDILPKNFTLRVLIMAAVITIMYGIAYLPWYLKDKKVKKQPVTA